MFKPILQVIIMLVGIYIFGAGVMIGIEAIGKELFDSETLLAVLGFWVVGAGIVYLSYRWWISSDKSEAAVSEKSQTLARRKDKLKIKELKKQNKNEKYAQLEAKVGWRLSKVAYAVLSVILSLSVLPAGEYEDSNTGAMFTVLIVSAVFYPIFKRIVNYIYFGKQETLKATKDTSQNASPPEKTIISNKEIITVEAVPQKNDKGGLSFMTSVDVAENTLFSDNRELRFKPVDKLAYEYSDEVFGKIFNKYKLTQSEGTVLFELIRLNSGYLSPELIQTHLAKSNAVCLDLFDDLVKHKQAAKKPDGRKLYLPPKDKRTLKTNTETV